MSKGMGRVQRGILEALESHGECDYGLLVEHIYGVGHYYGAAEVASVSRAVRTLERKGLVQKKRKYDTGVTEWSDFFGNVFVSLVKR